MTATTSLLLMCSLGCCAVAGAALAQAPSNAASPAAAVAAPAAKTASSRVGVPRSQAAAKWYARRYGVDHLQVRTTASGNSLEFRYRVLDLEKAKVLNDKRAVPSLIDVQTGNRLAVPTMEKIGALRQTSTPELGREYWMVFTNPGKMVKPGQRVDIVIGTFRVSGLIVE
jgi:pyruvate/2-oxoglutarate dehydrogenase complex dihydrolipoamide acyltransferase (E2) component